MLQVLQVREQNRPGAHHQGLITLGDFEQVLMAEPDQAFAGEPPLLSGEMGPTFGFQPSGHTLPTGLRAGRAC